MRTRLCLTLCALPILAVCLSGCGQKHNREVIYQTSTLSALLEGIYDGDVTLKELMKHGDLGLGTFNALDGEMLVVDGRMYQIRSDGKAYRPTMNMKTPFAAVTFFDVDQTVTLEGVKDIEALHALLDRELKDRGSVGKNIPIAIRITGSFSYVKTRSVPKQNKPYPRLVEVAKTQPTFEFNQVKGTVVGFRLPEFTKTINVTGWHLHFLTEDESAGGHILKLAVGKGRAELDVTPNLFVALPQGERFGEGDISKEKADEVRRIEK